MILTLLCQMLLLDTGTIAFPQASNRPNTTPSRSPHIPAPSPPPPLLLSSSSPPARAAESPVTTDLLMFSPSSNSRSVVSSVVSASIITPINGQSNKSSSRSYIRRRRDPIASPQQGSSDWLIPPFNPTQRPRTGSSLYNTNSYGLAYRSILPIRNSNVNHYTGLYRNRNIFSNGEQHNENDDYNNFNYNNGNNNNNQQQQKISHQEKNDIGGVNLEGHLDKVILKLPFATISTTVTPTTAESRIKSAPATVASGSVSSTLEMKEELEGTQVLASRDSIGGGGFKIIPQAPKLRQPKVHKPAGNEEQQDTIVFPGSVYRPPSKRTGSVRPGKATPSSTQNFRQSDDDYVPPPLKSLDKAAFESLKMLLETRRISQSLNARTASPKIGSGFAPVKPGGSNTTPPTSPLDIRGRPKCATQNSGYCDEIDTYPKEFFNQILKNSLTLTPDIFQEVFGDSIDNKTVASDLAGRDGLNLMLDSPLCSSIEHTIYPKVAENKDGKFMYIVNHDEYIQGVRVEKCVKEGSACMYLEGSLTGYQSTCRQKYIYRKLLAFTRDGKATTDTFRLPACCVCHVRSVFVDDRINTAGFGSDTGSDYAPSSIIIPKKGGDNSTLEEYDVSINSTVINLENDRLSDDSVTEMVHDDVMDFPTAFPDTVGHSNKNNGSEEDMEGGMTVGDPLIAFRAF